MSGLFNQYDSLKAYLTYIKTHKVLRHAPFLKMLHKYKAKQKAHAALSECQIGIQQLASHRTRFSRDAVISQVLSSHERSGMKERLTYDYIERPIWEKDNPGKTPPKVVKAWVMDTDTGF